MPIGELPMVVCQLVMANDKVAVVSNPLPLKPSRVSFHECLRRSPPMMEGIEMAMIGCWRTSFGKVVGVMER